MQIVETRYFADWLMVTDIVVLHDIPRVGDVVISDHGPRKVIDVVWRKHAKALVCLSKNVHEFPSEE